LRYRSTFYDIGVYENLYPKIIMNDPVHVQAFTLK